jgi:hypothetical protein
VLWITQGLQENRGQNVMENIVPLVLPTQLDSDSSDEEHEDDAEENAENRSDKTSSKYITTGVCDCDHMTYKKGESCNGTNKTGPKGIMVRSNI